MLVDSVYKPHNTKQTTALRIRGFWTGNGLHSHLGDTTHAQCFCGVVSKPPLANALGAP